LQGTGDARLKAGHDDEKPGMTVKKGRKTFSAAC
jgi:hypothetical protein